ncbi:MAG: outer membrane protein [Candidatus Eisenbacteria bacterium]|nr:outer membrane beta-barrel protein [Candidatus Eisenbacteria bacterium]
MRQTAKLVLLTGLLLAALAALAPREAQALTFEERIGDYGVQAGYAKAQDADSGDLLLGGHLELQPLPWLGIQGEVDYRSGEDISLSTVEGARGNLNVKTVPMLLSAHLYLPSPRGFEPYALAGAGWYRQIYDFSENMETAFGIQDKTKTTFGWHAGAGARISVAPRVSVFGEGRLVFLDPNRDFGGEVRQEIENIDYDSTYLVGGVSMHF